jgi:hypothetical protein
MWKGGLVAIVAVVIGSSAAVAGSMETESRFQVDRAEASLTMAQITRLKSVLKLTAEQELLWPAIESAFREISAAQVDIGASQGFVQRVRNKAASIGLNALALRRLASAASPLLRSLSEEQKQSGLTYARSAGLDKIAVAF